MASRREEFNEDARLRVMRLIEKSPNLSTRKVADSIGISTGSAYYVISALIEKGFVKIGNFKRSPRKGSYSYILTSKGLREKSVLAQRFIKRKQREYKVLSLEIEALERESELLERVLKEK